MDIGKIKEKIKSAILDLKNEDILAVGVFGSLARGDFHERSDIDIFVITQRELIFKEQDELYLLFSNLLSEFRRDVTVIVYDLKSLKKVPTWQTLNLIKDAYFIYDRAEIEEIFKKILQEAEKKGIYYDAQEKVFKLKEIERKVFSLEET